MRISVAARRSSSSRVRARAANCGSPRSSSAGPRQSASAAPSASRAVAASPLPSARSPSATSCSKRVRSSASGPIRIT